MAACMSTAFAYLEGVSLFASRRLNTPASYGTLATFLNNTKFYRGISHRSVYGGGILLVSKKCPSGYVHTTSSFRKDDRSVDKTTSNKSYEHGSVLTQFVGKEDDPKQLTTAKKVVEAGKDAGYMGIILAGLGFTGVLLWAVMSEFFSSNSPQKLFAKALRAVKHHEEAREILGEPISGYGDTSGRGRRRRISYQEYIANGEDYMRIIFYVAGSKRKGTAHMDLKKNESGKYICRYLVIELDGYPSAVITIEDNR